MEPARAARARAAPGGTSTGGTGGASTGGTGGASTGGTGGASTGGTGGASTGGTGGAGAVDCSKQPIVFPSFERGCTNAQSCVVEAHQIDCCGSQLITGINHSAKVAYEAAEKTCESQYPACGCAAGPRQDRYGADRRRCEQGAGQVPGRHLHDLPTLNGRTGGVPLYCRHAWSPSSSPV